MFKLHIGVDPTIFDLYNIKILKIAQKVEYFLMIDFASISQPILVHNLLGDIRVLGGPSKNIQQKFIRL